MDSTAYSLERTNYWKKNFVVAANHKGDGGIADKEGTKTTTEKF